MARKTFCDACGEETKSCYSFSYPCHIPDLVSGNGNLANAYVDNRGNPISGRADSVDLCNACTNRVMTAAVGKIKELQKKHGLSEEKNDA